MVRTATEGMTLDEFMQRYGDEGPFEIVEGEIVPVTPQITRSARIAGRLFWELTTYLKSKNLGEAFIETPFVTAIETNWVAGSRVPDVMFVRAERMTALAAADPEWESKLLTIVPDLAVEIVSPTDRLSDVSKKIAGYLQDGVGLVWLVEPDTQTVTIYTPGSKQLTHLDSEDTLTAAALIPGFEMPVAKLFGWRACPAKVCRAFNTPYA
jgi:Uma2 family endonuclease